MSDIDDQELGALFRAAASDSGAPPPAFDHDSVLDASRRATTRRRLLMTGGAIAVFALIGVGAAVALPGSPGNGTTVAAPMSAGDRAARPAAPQDASGAAGGAAEGAVPESPPPLGPGNTECADRQDPALRALVDQVLPEVAGAPEAATTMECRPGGERGVAVEAGEDGATGLLSVRYLPPGVVVDLPSGAVGEPTASGGTVIVSSSSSEVGAPAPFAGRLASVAAYLAPRL